MLLHSSGSTGTPKGAIIPERHAKFQLRRAPVPVPIVRLCFAPMNHLLGRAQVFIAFARGGTAYFTAKPDMSTLFEDFRLVRPTEAAFFPRVLEMIHRHYLSEVARRTGRGDGDAEAVSAQVMEEMGTTFLGDRISMIDGRRRADHTRGRAVHEGLLPRHARRGVRHDRGGRHDHHPQPHRCARRSSTTSCATSPSSATTPPTSRIRAASCA